MTEDLVSVRFVSVPDLSYGHYEIDIEGVPDGTVIIRFDGERRPVMDVEMVEEDVAGLSIHLPNIKDLEEVSVDA